MPFTIVEFLLFHLPFEPSFMLLIFPFIAAAWAPFHPPIFIFIIIILLAIIVAFVFFTFQLQAPSLIFIVISLLNSIISSSTFQLLFKFFTFPIAAFEIIFRFSLFQFLLFIRPFFIIIIFLFDPLNLAFWVAPEVITFLLAFIAASPTFIYLSLLIIAALLPAPPLFL